MQLLLPSTPAMPMHMTCTTNCSGALYVQASITVQVEKAYLLRAFGNAYQTMAAANSISKQLKAEYNRMANESFNLANDLADSRTRFSFDGSDVNLPTDIRMWLSPAIQGWTLASARLERDTQLSTTTNRLNDTSNNTFADGTSQTVLVYTITYRRSNFTQLFAMTIVIIMWILSVYLLVLAVDHIIVRRRPLEPDTVGFAVGMLFALPALRLLLAAPFGR